MNKFGSITKPLMWFMALLLAALVAGCGGGSSNSEGNSTLSSAKAINTFSLAWSSGATGSATGTIDQTLKTIKVNVPYGTNLNPMFATYTTTGTKVTVGTPPVTQVNVTTANDFSLPVPYKVIAADGTWDTYTVLVTVSQFTAPITSYSLHWTTGTAGNATGIIDETLKTIAVTVPYGTTTQDLSAMVATYATTSTSVTIGTPPVTQNSGAAPTNDFSTSVATPVVYRVNAADGTLADYKVTVTVAQNSAKAITGFTLAASGVASTTTVITESAVPKTIAVTMPNGTTDLTALVATYTTDGAASVTVGTPEVTQVSGTTANDFSTSVATPVVYKVYAANGTSAFYDVSVTVAAAPPGPNLLRTASFAILAGTSITSAGTTTVTGDVGATGVTGTAPTVTGNYYPVGNEVPYTDAMTDLPTVLADANNTTNFPCGSNISGGIGTQSLAPGVYCISANAAISGVVNLTLNGAGVYIFRTGGALTPAATSIVQYGGSATDANTTVFWVVGSANLGTPATWMGNILSGGAVTLGDTDTLVKGRVLTTAAVTISNNTVTKP